MTQDLRIGLVGAGYFAGFHRDAWLRMPGARLVALADADPDALQAALSAARDQSERDQSERDQPGLGQSELGQSELGQSGLDQSGLGQPGHSPDSAVRGFASLEAMLAEVVLDIVDIATPPDTHRLLVDAASGSGATVICQKPLAPTYAQAQDLVSAAESAGTLLVVHENIRFTPWHRELARFIVAGRLGAPHAIAMRLRPGDGQGASAYLHRQPYFQQMPRFLVHETAVHWVDTFRYLFGEVRGVFARLQRMNPVIAGEDRGLVTFAFDNGADGIFDANRLNDHDTDNARRTMGELWVEGAAGVMRLDGRGNLNWKPHGEPERPHPYAWADRGFAGDAVFATQAHVVNHLRDGAPLENTGREYLRNLEIVEAIYRSNDTGSWIELPPR